MLAWYVVSEFDMSALDTNLKGTFDFLLHVSYFAPFLACINFIQRMQHYTNC
jgi:hypothetical protein